MVGLHIQEFSVSVLKTLLETTDKVHQNCIKNNRNASKISMDLYLIYRKNSIAINPVCESLVWTYLFKVYKFKGAAHIRAKTYSKGWLDLARSFVQLNKKDPLLLPPKLTEQIKWTRTLLNSTHKGGAKGSGH